MSNWYLRPAGATYGSSNGTTYADAWTAPMDSTKWANVLAGDTLYIAGTHHGVVSGAAATFVVMKGGASESPLTIASCTTVLGASTNDPGIIWAGKLIRTTDWIGEYDGETYPDLYYKEETHYLRAVNVESGGNVLEKKTSIAECAATPGSYFSDTVYLYYMPSSELVDIHFGGSGAFLCHAFAATAGNNYLKVKGLELYQGYFDYDGSEYQGVLTISREIRNYSITDIEIDGCTIAYAGATAIQTSGVEANNITIKNCTIFDCGAGWYSVSVSGATDPYQIYGPTYRRKHTSFTFSDNLCYQTSNRLKSPPFRDTVGETLAVGTMGGVDSFTISRNTFTDWVGEAVFCFLSAPSDFTATMHDLTISGNRIAMQEVDGQANQGIQIGGSTTTNFTERCKRTRVYNNVISGCHKHTLGGFDGWDAAIRLKHDSTYSIADDIPGIWNNTIFDSYKGIALVATVGQAASLRNNIVSNPSDSGFFVYSSVTGNLSGLTADYNDYNGTGYWEWDGGTPTTSFATWKSTSSQDANSITDDPLFTAAGAGNFSLSANSPCRDSGTAVAVYTDYTGAARPIGSGYDIGAYEYGLIQVASPDSDVATTNWVAVPTGDFYGTLDEASPDASDYCYTSTSSATLEVGLSDISLTEITAGWTLRYAVKGNCTVSLRQGTDTEIASYHHSVSAVTVFSQELTPEEVALITDGADLRVRIVSD